MLFTTWAAVVGIPVIDVRFYPYAGLRHTIRLRSGQVYVRLSDICRDSPPEVMRAPGLRARGEVAREENSRRSRPHLSRVFLDSGSDALVRHCPATPRRKMISSARGHVYDLEKMFSKLNRRYFDSSLEKPTLTWSQRKTRSILGHHDRVYETITISKSLDSTQVPEWFVEFILYHEMLHIKHAAAHD